MAITTPDPIMNGSVMDCCHNSPSSAAPSSTAPQTAAGPVPVTEDPTWTTSCVGGGDVPVALNVTASEIWDY